jgi:hypothetical protein
LPVPSKRPFQPDEGIQRVILISESDEGVSTRLTLQNGGTEYATPSGAVKDPPATGTAAVIRAFAICSVERFWQLLEALVVVETDIPCAAARCAMIPVSRAIAAPTAILPATFDSGTAPAHVRLLFVMVTSAACRCGNWSLHFYPGALPRYVRGNTFRSANEPGSRVFRE